MKKLLQAVTVFYVFVIALVLPLFFKPKNGYASIGTDKALLFQDLCLPAATLLLLLFVAYVLLSFMEWLRLHKGEKGKWAKLWKAGTDSLSLTDKFVIFYLLSLVISYYFTDYPESLRWGMQGWYMGLLTQLILLGFYFAVSRLFSDKMKKITVITMLGVSFLVFFLGILNRYGLNPLGMVAGNESFISTIGNINWLCGYWSVLFPLGAGLFLCYENKEDKKFSLWHILLGIYVAVGFASALTQGSDSGMLAFAAMIILMGVLATGEEGRFRNFLQLLLICCGVTMLFSLTQLWMPEQNTYQSTPYKLLTGSVLPWVLFGVVFLFYRYAVSYKHASGRKTFRTLWTCLLGLTGAALLTGTVLLISNTLHPGSIGGLSRYPIFTFNESWGSSRGATWTYGMQTWLSQDALHKIVGIGPDGMAAYVYNGPNEALREAVKDTFNGNRMTNAHGEAITLLANGGILGLVGFMGALISGVCCFLKKGKKNIFCMACGLSIFCYMINNVFSFWQIMNITQMFLVLGLGTGFLREGTKQMSKILIVEDDADINQILAKIMQKQGHETVQAFSGSEAELRLFMNGEIPYDLIMLDLMLPGVMGEDLIQKIREKSEVPVIVLSAKTALEDRVHVLNLGADDYLTKPFQKEEVIARVNAALRRYSRFQTAPTPQAETAGKRQTVLTYKELTLYPEERVAKLSGTEFSLTAHEYELLLLLVQNPGKVYSRENLYEQVWQGGYYGEDNTVNVHISNLRKKLAAFTDEEYIKTVWGIGFKMA